MSKERELPPPKTTVMAVQYMHEGNPWVREELYQGTIAPGQTSNIGALAGFQARAAGASTSVSRAIAQNTALQTSRTMEVGAPEFRSIDRSPHFDTVGYNDPATYAQLTFGRDPQSNRLIQDADIQSHLGVMPDQNVDINTGVYTAGRVARDASQVMLAFNQQDVGGALQQWREVYNAAMPLAQRGLAGDRGLEEVAYTIAQMPPEMLAAGMGISADAVSGALATHNGAAAIRDNRAGF